MSEGRAMKRMSDPEIAAAAIIVEKFIIASGERRNPILVGLDRQAAIALMPDLYDWLHPNDPESPDSFYYEPTGRKPFVSVDTNGISAAHVIEKVNKIRQSYFDFNYNPGPVVFFCRDLSINTTPIQSVKGIDQPGLDTHHAIAAIFSYFSHYIEQQVLLCCHPSHVETACLEKSVGQLSPNSLSGHFRSDLDTVAPHTSLVISSDADESVAVLDFASVDMRGMYCPLAPPYSPRHRTPRRTPMYSALHLESLCTTDIHSETQRFLEAQRGSRPRSDRDYLIDVRQAARHRQWIAANGCDRILYEVDVSSFGLEVSSLSDYTTDEGIVADGNNEANSSGKQIAIRLGPDRQLDAFALPNFDLNSDSQYFCFSVKHVDPSFIVDFLNTAAVHNYIISRSAGSWTNPSLGRQSVLSLPVPAVTINEYKIISQRMTKIAADRDALELLGSSLEDLARWHQGDDFELGDIQPAIDFALIKPMYDGASDLLEELHKVVRPTIPQVVYPPYPMAVALRSIQSSVSNIERLKRLFESAEIACRTMCFLLASDPHQHLHTESMRRKLDNRGSLLMTFGEWVGWLRSFRKNESNSRSRLLKQAVDYLDQIVPLRNNFSHGTTPPEAGVHSVLSTVSSLFDSLCDSIPEAMGALWIFGTEVVQRRDGATWGGYSLNGDHPEFNRQSLGLPRGDPRLEFPAQEIHSFFQDRWKSLWPWIVLDSDQHGHRRIFWWDGLNARGQARYTPIGAHGDPIYREQEGHEIRSRILRS